MATEHSVKIWKLTRTDSILSDEWGAVVVAGISEKDAREQANKESATRGQAGYVWTDSGRVSAEILSETAVEGVYGFILSSPDGAE